MGKFKVLIVDDDEQGLYMLQTLLESHGYEVEKAASGTAALEAARKQPPALIIADILMPVMDGFTLCRLWKKEKKLKEIPFVFYTATYTDAKDKELALKLGADRFIIKPEDPEGFVTMVKAVIRDAKKGKIKPGEPLLEDEEETCKLYNERLVRKLEEKMLDLEREIMERKHMEEELRKAHQSLRLTQFSVDHSGDAAFWMGPDARFIYVNERACQSLGYSREELLTMTVLDIDVKFSGDVWEDHWKEIRQHRRFTIESVHKTKDGHTFPVEISINFLEFEGKEYNFAFARDISDRKQAEQTLRTYAETQEVLLREVNHRVKNNLSALISILHKEEDRAGREGMWVYLPLLQDLVGQVQGLLTVHALLSSRKWRPLNLGELCMKVIKATLKGVPHSEKVYINIAPTQVRVNADQAHHLTLVVNELAANSLKYARQADESVRIAIEIKVKDKNMELWFRDNGPGYPAEMLLGDLSRDQVGFDLIRGIVKKNLKGTLRLENQDGAVTVVSFKSDLPPGFGGG